LHMTDTAARAASAHGADRAATTFQTDLLDRFRAQAAGRDLWVFGYASLLWRPEFEAQEQHITRVWGWHRALKPTFTLFVNRDLPAPYVRYLERAIREGFGFGSVPLKLRMRRKGD
jgi:hypothetical protein